MFKIEKGVPLPTMVGETGHGELAKTIMSMEEDDSFFVACAGDKRATMQKNIQTKCAELRKKNKIIFFVVTRRVTENDEDGLRVWRRPTGIDDLDETV